MNTTYLVDTEGNKIAVQIPIAEWNLMEEEIQKLRKKLEVLQGIKDAVAEVKTARQEDKKLQSLDDFLNEF
ncbi:hypothetical protein [Bernardetia sp.]|uniref:hypothetical protein n=1 Tax=Bernardetia sp. TaxID=1937974 RepID=UPI0025BD50FB|nr:hypothetical protein [Bernardetia sp.]